MCFSGKEPLVTLIIPVYNVCQYLRQCLDSVIAQEYDNLEIVVIDDGSTDGSCSIIDEYAARDKRFYVEHTVNHGLSCARNIGLDHAHGVFYAFLDSDDWMEPDTIKRLVKYASLYNADIVACRACKEWANKREESQMPSNFAIYDGETACYELICQGHIGHGVWNKLYRTSLFSVIRFPQGDVCEDIATTYRLLLLAKKVVWIPDTLLHWRMRRTSITHTYNIKNAEDGWRAFYEMYVVMCKKGVRYRNKLIQNCMGMVLKMWFCYPDYQCKDQLERTRKTMLYHEMREFAHSHCREIIFGNFSKKTKIACLLGLCDNYLVLWILAEGNAIRKFFLRKQMRETRDLFV